MPTSGTLTTLPILTDPYRPDFRRIGAERANIIRGGYGAAMGDVARGAATAARAADVGGGAAASREAAAAAAPAIGRLGHQMTSGLAEARQRTRAEEQAYETAMSQRRQDILGTTLGTLGTMGGMLTSALGGGGGGGVAGRAPGGTGGGGGLGGLLGPLGGLLGGGSSSGAPAPAAPSGAMPGGAMPAPMSAPSIGGGGVASAEMRYDGGPPSYLSYRVGAPWDPGSYRMEFNNGVGTRTPSGPMPAPMATPGTATAAPAAPAAPSGADALGPLSSLLGGGRGGGLAGLAGTAAPIAGMINPLAGLGLGAFSRLFG